MIKYLVLEWLCFRWSSTVKPTSSVAHSWLHWTSRTRKWRHRLLNENQKSRDGKSDHVTGLRTRWLAKIIFKDACALRNSMTYGLRLTTFSSTYVSKIFQRLEGLPSTNINTKKCKMKHNVAKQPISRHCWNIRIIEGYGHSSVRHSGDRWAPEVVSSCANYRLQVFSFLRPEKR